MRRTLKVLVTLVCVGLTMTAAAVVPARAVDTQHRSLLRIGPGEVPATRTVRLGLNKSMIIELPREVSDVMVSNPKKIDAVLQTATRAYLIGNEVGEANIFLMDRNGNQIATLEVSVERDLSALGPLLGELIPGSNIKVQAFNENVVLTGTVTSPIDATRAGEIANSFVGKGLPQGASMTQGSSFAEGGGPQMGSSTTTSGPTEGGKVINMITVEGREQVLLKVSVVEMERNIVKQFGVDLNALVNSGSFAFAALSNLPFPINTAGGGLLAPFLNASGSPTSFLPVPGLPNSPPGLPALDPAVGNTSGFGTQWTSGQSRVQSVLRALEQNGLLHTLAEPNLTAISGETANFLAGGEFPIPVAQQLGTISVEFKKFGIGLAFTPVVMSEGRISLKVSTEVSELSNQGAVILSNISIPALKVRRAETMVELPSGGSLVMAGLLSDQSKQAISGYPGLKDLPILGTLFRSRDFLKNETELVVLVTPYVVRPSARGDLATPDDGFGWASDVQSDLLGQMNRVYGRNPERAPVGRFEGDVGFIVE